MLPAGLVPRRNEHENVPIGVYCYGGHSRQEGCLFISSSPDLLRDATMLTDSQKTKAQLIEELKSLRSRVAAFEQPARGANALQRSDILPALYATAPVGLCYLDTELRFVFINEWLADINGLSVEQHLGRRIREVLLDVAAGVESQFRHVIETGEPIFAGGTPRWRDFRVLHSWKGMHIFHYDINPATSIARLHPTRIESQSRLDKNSHST